VNNDNFKLFHYLPEDISSAGGMAQAVEHLPSECKALSSNSYHYKKSTIITSFLCNPNN
jgi:hypothetical protein